MDGASEQRDTSGRRGWWLVGSLAVCGAGLGAYAGHRLEPEVIELVPTLAAVGLGLGGIIGMLLLTPVGVWRAWRRRRHRRAATSEHAAVPHGAGLWRTPDPDRELERPATPPPQQPSSEPDHAAVSVDQGSPAPPSQGEAAREAAKPMPEPEPEELPPPEGEEPGWYADPAGDGVRRYWDGQAWTGHVWRGREERTRTTRKRR